MTMMNQTHVKRSIPRLLAAAVASVAMVGIGQSVQAQYQIGADGRLLDANPQVGSGGLNTGGRQIAPGAMGNLIITGNVTGGREFRGNAGYGDRFEFRGDTGGRSLDRFIRQSSGVPIRGGDSNFNAQTFQPFYGDGRAVAPPPGFVQQSPGGGFIPAPSAPQRPASDLRLGTPLDGAINAMPQPGQFALPGQVDPGSINRPVMSASPLYGIREMSAAELRATDPALIANYNQAARGMRMDRATLEQLQAELRQPVAAPTVDPTRAPGPLQADSTTPSAMPNQPLPTNAVQTQALGADVQQLRQFRQQALVGPEAQSTQYAEMQARLQQLRRPGGPTEQELDRQFTDRFRTTRQPPTTPQADPQQQAQPRPGQPAQPGVAPVPGTPTTPGAVTPRPTTPQPTMPPGVAPDAAAPPTGIERFGQPDLAARSRELLEGRFAETGPVELNKPKPVQVESLAAGIRAKGLAEFLSEAEALMKAQRFSSALDQYDMAEQVAPNNPLIRLGRANAELGAAYYARAEENLRKAFAEDQALLMAQYDLKAFLGEARLEYLVKDLKEIAHAEQRSPRPVFLLAYIAYNTGNERAAAGYLDLAERRAGGNDPIIRLMREHWALPIEEGEQTK
jgi:tetratricopeptide (TPR) repeat protein